MTNQSELLLMFIVLPWSLEDDKETSFSSNEKHQLLTAESHNLQHSGGNTYSSVITWREWQCLQKHNFLVHFVIWNAISSCVC